MINSREKRSKRHHYLPSHYLEGFINETGVFFIYDKEKDNIFTHTPNTFFYENELNTVTLQSGMKTSFLEDLYTSNENAIWDAIDRIRNSGFKDEIALMDKMSLFHFISVLHWRLPSNYDAVADMSVNFFSGNIDFSSFSLKKKNGNDVSEDEKNEIRNSESFKKVSKLMMPFLPFGRNDWGDKIQNWRLLYTEDGGNWYIVGDNPIITSGLYDNDPIRCLDDFLFPISGKILLVGSKKKITNDFNGNFILQFGASVIERSNRFIACPRKDYLESLVRYYKEYVRFDKKDDIIKDLFQMLK